MPRRQDPEGRWHVELCVGGRRVHRRLKKGATSSDAKRLEAELIRALAAQGRALTRVPSIPGDPLLAELMSDYTERHALTLRSPDTARYHALRIGRWIDGHRASQAREVAQRIREDMHGHYSVGTINRSLSALRKALKIAFERGDVAVDYGSTIKLAPENNARTTSLTLEQVQRLADCASPAVRAAIWISVYTGCRRGEILAVRPGDISDDELTIHTGNTKTLRTRTVPIIAPVRPWLAQVPIGIGAEGLKSGFRRARKAAGMPHVTFHDLRRSCGTLLIRAGVPLHVVSRLLGHSSTSVTERVYAHLGTRELRRGLDVLAALAKKAAVR